MSIGIFDTHVESNAFDFVKDVLHTTFLSEGQLVKNFEKKLSQELGIINPVAVNSGTSALHLSLVLANIQKGDEVIIPAQTFVATGLVVIQQQAKVVFADIQYETGNICPKSILVKITDKTKAIIVVHWGGNPCDMTEITQIAKKHNLVVIEDAAHALGATYKNKPIGSISDYTCFSFQAIKHLTTGDGGLLSVLKNDIAKDAFVKRWFGIDRANALPSILGERIYDINELGFKYHLNDYAAALGLANLINFSERLAHIQKIARYYNQELNNTAGIQIFTQENDRKSAYWLYGFHIEKREQFIKMMQAAGITTSVIHLGIDHNSIFGGKQQGLINQRKFDNTQIHIPIHAKIDDEKAAYIVETIKKGW